MPGRIPENILEEILNRLDIVEIISGYIPLKRAGRNFKTNCPFHHEKTPSFVISPERQIYHCFGCGESGNAFKFLMRYERMDFMEAVETLARKAGVNLPEKESRDHKTEGLVTQLYKVNELAALFYEENLKSASGTGARNYLSKRGIKEETVKSFKLGFAADRWDALITFMRQKGVPLSLLEKAGLILPKESGGFYDRFRSRIIFPVFDIKSRVIGFGARVMDETLPKYINSPETPIYIKGNNLYGMHQAKDAIRDLDFVAVVEGYLDFIIPYQEGQQNIVASLGTALTQHQARIMTQHQARIIKRYTHNVVMIYDSDLAGQLATLRSLDIFIEEGMNVKVVCLPEGLDPDLFVRKNGFEGLKKKIEDAEGLFDFKIDILKTRYNVNEIEGRAKIAHDMLTSINKFTNAVLRSEYTRRLAEELKIKEEALLEDLRNIKKEPRSSETSIHLPRKPLAVNPTEKMLLKLLLEENNLINQIKEDLEPGDFQDERIWRIASLMFDFVAQGKEIKASSLLNYIDDEVAYEVVCESALPEELSFIDKEKMAIDCVRRMKTHRLRNERQLLHEKITAAENSGDQENLQHLMRQFHELIKRK
ncbi:MAG: DNA primase [Candidatus Omnitrophica bacterium]|nr:DNA primase [Candidatus Omnitrophota bacterium]